MKLVHAIIEGTSPLLQHRFPDDGALEETSNAVETRDKYADDWKKAAYVTENGDLYQPAIHIEECLKKAAVNYKVAGRRGKTFKDAFSAGIFVRPDFIPHGIKMPDQISRDPSGRVYCDVRPVRVQRARVMRQRFAFAVGWRLAFDIEFNEDLVDAKVIQKVLQDGGEQVGIGDFRPRFGRFRVASFEIA